MLLSKCMLFGVEWGKPSCLPRCLERPGWPGAWGKHVGLPRPLDRPRWHGGLGANTKVCPGVLKGLDGLGAWGKHVGLPRPLDRPGWHGGLGANTKVCPSVLKGLDGLGANTKVCLGVSIFYLAALSRFTSMASRSKPDIQTENRPSQSP